MPNPIKIKKGMRFGRIETTGVCFSLPNPSGRKVRYAVCLCDCGSITNVMVSDLIRGHTKSCNCLAKEIISKLKTKHGIRRDHPNFYHLYYKIKKRCNDVKSPDYKWYGARGIKCLWKTVKEFYDDMHPSYIKHQNKFGKKDTSIDRTNNNGNYCKENCRWATYKEQANNRRPRCKN